MNFKLWLESNNLSWSIDRFTKTKTINVSDLITNERTPKELAKVAQYRKSMEKGAKFPIIRVLPVQDGYFVTDGHHRVLAAMSLGLTALPAESDTGDFEYTGKYDYENNRVRSNLRVYKDCIDRRLLGKFTVPNLPVEEWLLKEDFNNVLEFLLNPKYREKSWQDLMRDFQASGGQFLGSGQFGSVFSHPKWQYVVKLFNDPYYLKFVRLAVRTPHPSFPKFFGTAQKIIPFYKRSLKDATQYVVRVEKLQSVTDDVMIREIVQKCQGTLYYFDAVERGEGDKEIERMVYATRIERKQGLDDRIIKEKYYKNTLDFFAKYPKAKSLCEGLHIINKNIKEASFDIQESNIMQRQNGDLVWSDPLWGGSNPYNDERMAMDKERDSGENYEREDLMGGELPKRKSRRNF